MSFIEFKNVKKIYKSGETECIAANNVSFSVEKGELCVIVGSSGAGKTTLLNMLGGMDSVTDGVITVDGQTVSGMSAKQLTAYRRYDVGFVFQFYNLVQNLTAVENVELAAQICRNPKDAAATLAKVGLEGKEGSFPSQLSGGEQQRVAIARALAKSPKLLLCDEPTGALDYKTGKAILRLLYDTCRSENMTVIIITHNSALKAMADRVITVKSGSIENITENKNPVPIERIEW